MATELGQVGQVDQVDQVDQVNGVDHLGDQGDGAARLRSAVTPIDPQVNGDWLVSGHGTDAELRLVDCSPVVKVLLQAPPAGPLAGHLAVPFGRAELFEDGYLVICTAPGEWLLLCPADPSDFLDRLRRIAPGQPVGIVDLTHGRTLLRVTGRDAQAVLVPLTAVDLSERDFPTGSATSAAVAGVRVVVVRDDLFADEAGLPVPPPPDGVVSAAGPDDEQPDVASYLLCCERSAGLYLYERLLGVGQRQGLAEEGYVHYRARRADV